MEFLLILVCMPLGLLLGMSLGRMIPVVGYWISSANEFMKTEIGVSISELFFTAIFSAMALAFWQIPNWEIPKIGPEWISLAMKLSFAVASIILFFMTVLKIIIKQIDRVF